MQRDHQPLIFFTLIGQTAIGLSWLIGSVKPNFPHPHWLLLPPLILICLALIISTLHLHYPRNSWRSLSNWSSSPLSQEAIAATVFFVWIGFEYVLMMILPTWPLFSPEFFFTIRIVLGIFLILAMARLYLLRTIPVWNRLSTPLSFFSSSFLLGAATSCLLSMPLNHQRFCCFLLAGLVVRIASHCLPKPSANQGGAIQRNRYQPLLSEKVLANPGFSFLTVLLIIIFEAGGAFFYFKLLLYVALCLSEYYARALFYRLHGHDRSLFPAVCPAISSWRETLVTDDQPDPPVGRTFSR